MKTILFYFLFVSFFSFSQSNDYTVAKIPDSLRINANSVVRLSNIDINIEGQNSMTIYSKKVTTVLNDIGFEDVDLSENYDRNRKIAMIEVAILDAFGKEIKRYKRKDFKDTSIADGVSIFNDNRALYLQYTPTSYPFTIVFETEVNTSNTAFIPSWRPLDDYLVSVEKTTLQINYKPELKLNNKECNFSKLFTIEKHQDTKSITYKANNIVAKKREELAPSFSSIFPYVLFALENFRLENVDGNATNWQEFGKWYYKELLSDTEELPEATIAKIKQLIGNEKNTIEIAKKVYQYVQEKTRYVSVQVGIGGWKPMLAKDVDKLGYGDCKALSNYTRSLLKAVGIDSFFTVVFAGSNETRDLQNDIASIQGNHAILALPTEKEMLWLECTSQIQPFGFQGDFTDDRNVLVIKPTGGEIIKTKIFTAQENIRKLTGNYSIDRNGSLRGKVNIVSKGLHYDNEFQIVRQDYQSQLMHFKEQFDNINNIKISNLSFNNNKDAVIFTEDLMIEAENYAQNTGGKLMFALNAFSQLGYVPKKYKDRTQPFQLERGYSFEDEITISIPTEYKIEAKPTGLELATEFGNYKIEFIEKNANTILCKRNLVLKHGLFEKSKFESYRKFRETIAKNDNSKIIISEK